MHALLEVVEDDVNYEISCVEGYIKHIEEQIKRLNKRAEYIEVYNNATKARDKNDFKELIEYILQPGETIENYSKIIEEYKKAYEVRKAHIDKLKTEIKKIRQIKVDDWI